MKRALLAQEDAYLSLLDLRNTPTQGMTTSPAERMLNRRTKTLLQTSQKLLQPKLNLSVPQEKGMNSFKIDYQDSLFLRLNSLILHTNKIAFKRFQMVNLKIYNPCMYNYYDDSIQYKKNPPTSEN